MTRLWILSDLHRDHGRTSIFPPSDADVAVIAGDAVDDEWLREIAAILPVVFVAGNHEFYGHDIQGRKESLSALPIHFLDDRAVEVGGVRFVGATLWTDYGRDPVCAEAARRGMNDHRHITWQKQPWQRFLPSHATKLHEASAAYLSGELALRQERPTVVVTHHAPSVRSVHSKFTTGPYAALNRAYYSDLDELVAASGAALWVHGHVHSTFDYTIGSTRVLCNPHGYASENPAFNPTLVVDCP